MVYIYLPVNYNSNQVQSKTDKIEGRRKGMKGFLKENVVNWVAKWNG